MQVHDIRLYRANDPYQLKNEHQIEISAVAYPLNIKPLTPCNVIKLTAVRAHKQRRHPVPFQSSH